VRRLASAIAVTFVVFFAWHSIREPRTLYAQVRAQTVAPSAPADVRDWDNTASRLLRSGELRVRLQRADTLLPRRTIEQLDQYHRGVRVWGGSLSRQLDDSSAVSVFGVIYAGITLDPTPTLTESDAVAAIERIGGARFSSARRLELVVLPIDDGFKLAWVGELMPRRDVVRYFVDAANGQPLRHYGMLQRQIANASIGHGTGVLGDDKKVSATSSGGAFLASDPLRPPSIVTYDMRGNTGRALDALNGDVALVTADVAANGTNNWTDAAVVDAHSYSAYTYDYYFKRFGRRGLDNADHPLRNMVHTVNRSDIFEAPGDILGALYLNAFYCGACAGGTMVYGEGLPGGVYLPSTGQFFDYFSGALDVVAHELTHGVTNYSSNLEYVNESGALNEAFSDMMGTSVEFFFQPPGTGLLRADYLIGEDIARAALPGALDGVRSMSNPALFDQPDHYSKLVVLPPDEDNDNGGVHTNSGIPNHAFYLAIEWGTNRTSGIRVQGVGASNREQIEKVFYRGFTQLMPANATFSVARAVTLRAAQDLYGLNSAPYNAVRDAWTAVGVN
jgi:bacillolysin